MLAAALGLTGLIVAPPAQAGFPQGLNDVAQPEDLAAPAGQQTTLMPCVTCHGTDIIREQRLSRAGWTREVEKMIGWGASVGVAEQEKIVDCVSAQFGLTTPPPVASRGKEATATALLPRCLVCHDLRLVEQQQLTASGWSREISKMIDWGASLTESEARVLSDYLATRSGQRR